MGRASNTKKLGLWMNGAHVGTWSTSPHGHEELQYSREWVEGEHGRPLSLSLPILAGGQALRGEVVRNYFENLLPDAKQLRERIARRHQARSTQAFDLLAEVGRDCVGALQILPFGTVPEGVVPVNVTPLSDTAVAALLRNMLAPAPLVQPEEDDDFRISIAGAQEKTALTFFEGRWCLPHGATPTTHILKLPLGLVGGQQVNMRDSVENEWLCAQIIRAYGLPAAECEPLTFDGQKVLSVARFDRTWWTSPQGDHRLLRLPQEDMCQATGTPPWLKYENDGGPGMDAIFKLLRSSATREQDLLNFFQAQVIFWMLCATDGHAKNFSIFLQPAGRYRMTPLYDVLSAYPILGKKAGQFSPFKVKMAMAFRSTSQHYRMREILRRHMVAVGERQGVAGLLGESVDKLLDSIAARTPAVIEAVSAQLPDVFPTYVAETIFQGLTQSAKTLQSVD